MYSHNEDWRGEKHPLSQFPLWFRMHGVYPTKIFLITYHISALKVTEAIYHIERLQNNPLTKSSFR